MDAASAPSLLLSEVAAVVRDHVTDNKILLAPTMADARNLLEQLALSGTPWLNVRPATPGMLASSFAKLRLARLGLAEVSDVTGLLLVEEALAAMANSAAAPGSAGAAVHTSPTAASGYFTRVARTPGVVQAVFNSIAAVRLAGLISGDLAPEHFVDPVKGQEFIGLLKVYEEGLKQRGFADRADVLRAALEEARAGGYLMREKNLYLIPAALKLRGLELRLVEEIARGRRVVLKQDSVVGATAPAGYPFLGEAQEGAGAQPPGVAGTSDAARPLSWLMSPAGAITAASAGAATAAAATQGAAIDIFHATSPYNEVREALRRILASGVPFDQAALITTDTDLYHRIIDGVTRKLGVPTTFAEGLSILGTRPGRALTALLRWVDSDWGVDALRRALAAGDIVLKTDDRGHTGGHPAPGPAEHGPSGMALARALRGLGIGWGRDRYLPALEAAIHEQETRLADATRGAELGHGDGDEASPPDTTAIERKLSTLQVLKSGVTSLLDALPAPDAAGAVDVGQLVAGLAALVERYAPATSEDDAAASTAILEQLREAADLAAGSATLAEAADRINSLVSGLRVGASGPRPGHLHVAGYHRAGWTLRPQTFVLGLDEGRFPGAGLQDPVLLDEERRRINAATRADLPLATERVRQNAYDLALLLAGLPGQVTFSFASRDPIEEKSVFPASILLQAYRLREGEPEADYSEMLQALGRPVGYGPGLARTSGVAGLAGAGGAANGGEHKPPLLDALDWWLTHLIGRDAADHHEWLVRAEDAVRGFYPGLDQGLIAQAARDSDAVTEYDGQVQPDPALDPRQNAGTVLSASGIEKLATCPYAYFLRYVLGVKPPEDLEYDPTRWLDPMQKGTLLHDIFRQFLEDLTARGAAKPQETDRARIIALAEEAIQHYRDEVPPPGEPVYEYERRELLRSAQVFFNMEMAAEVAATPRYFELGFGFGDNTPANSQPELPQPATIDLGGGRSIKMRGRIDRVDEMEPHRYQIWDYKTGSSSKYEDHEYLVRGRQVQHALYAIALEEVLRAADPEAQVVSAGYLFPTEKGEGRRVNRQQDRRDRVKEVLGDLFDLVEEGTFVAAEDGYGCHFCDYAEACGGSAAAERTKMKLDGPDSRLAPLGRLKEHE
ncbi:MAG: PD-(D/E)XK nuclease family protein [Symbiobacteriia bacterium]